MFCLNVQWLSWQLCIKWRPVFCCLRKVDTCSIKCMKQPVKKTKQKTKFNTESPNWICKGPKPVKLTPWSRQCPWTWLSSHRNDSLAKRSQSSYWCWSLLGLPVTWYKCLHTKSHPGQVKYTHCWDSPRCVESSGFCSSFPEAALLQRTWKPDSNIFRSLPGSGGSVFSSKVLTWKLHWGFCSSLQTLFWPGHPTPFTNMTKHVSSIHLADISSCTVSSQKRSSPGS